MDSYKIYELNAQSRISRPPYVVICENDDVAVGEGRKHIGAHGVEIWQGVRFVINLKPDKRSK